MIPNKALGIVIPKHFVAFENQNFFSKLLKKL
jgi:hypothetical protein